MAAAYSSVVSNDEQSLENQDMSAYKVTSLKYQFIMLLSIKKNQFIYFQLI